MTGDAPSGTETGWSGVASAPPTLLDPLAPVVQAALGRDADALRRLGAFLSATDIGAAARAWLDLTRPDASVAPSVAERLLHCDVAAIDVLLNEQVNAILHHRSFQRLEASWRGLRLLTNCADSVREMDTPSIKVRVLDCSWRELVKDLDRAMEFDQSQLFKKVYSDEFDTPGGEPFAVVLGDYEVRHRPGPGHPTNDVDALRSIAQVGAAAFAPILVGADPVLLGLDAFSDLEIAQNMPRTFEQVEYTKWKAFRQTDDARFVGVTLPRVLLRLPYDGTGIRSDGFCFSEDVSEPDRSGYLWGTGVFAFGTVLIRAFADCGWLADIRGAPTEGWAGGLVVNLPSHSFGTDANGLVPKYSTDVLITDDREKELADLGFIPLCQLKGTPLAAFFSNQSCQLPKRYETQAGDTNARLSAMLQYLFCVARFAHYLKVMARDKVGSMTTAAEIERHLQHWVLQYCTASEDVGLETKARYPLNEAKVQIREHPAKPGKYVCVMHLKPHFQLDQVVSAVKLVTELAPMQV